MPAQAWALTEAEHTGILAPIGVGHGKTLIDLLIGMMRPGTKNVLLLVPAQLKAQLLQQDVPFYGQHWKLPNIAGSPWYYPDRPTLHVMSYTELQLAKNTATLAKLKVERVVCDEAHSLSGKGPRATRYREWVRGNPDMWVDLLSGTLTKREGIDWYWLAVQALGERAPVPLFYPTQTEWSQFSIPESKRILGPGVLTQFCAPGESAVEGLQRRVRETFGVIATADNAKCDASLEVRAVNLAVPDDVSREYDRVQNAWVRPDGEELVDALSVNRCLTEVSSGFFYRWRWPRQEPPEVIRRWLAARKAWHSEVREKLKNPRVHMDSPLLVARAAIRWYNGYVHIVRDQEGKILERQKIPPFTAKGPMPAWESATWPEWRDCRKLAQPQTEPVWISDFVVQYAKQWAAQHKSGIIWYKSDALGRAVAKELGAPLYGPGKEASAGILKEDGKRVIVASVRAHGTGKNLQMFCNGLILELFPDGATWEQLLGRQHRPGQLADTVTFYVLQHTPIYRENLAKARELAGYIQGTFGSDQKLVRVARFFT